STLPESHAALLQALSSIFQVSPAHALRRNFLWPAVRRNEWLGPAHSDQVRLPRYFRSGEWEDASVRCDPDRILRANALSASRSQQLSQQLLYPADGREDSRIGPARFFSQTSSAATFVHTTGSER